MLVILMIELCPLNNYPHFCPLQVMEMVFTHSQHLVQVRSMITLQSGGLLSFGLAWFSTSVFELVAEEVLMSDSTIKVYGALKLTVKMLLMWNSTIKVDGNPDDFMLATSTIETSNLVILRVRILNLLLRRN